MGPTELTLFIEDLATLAAAAPDRNWPALQRCLARGRRLDRRARDANALRLDLFSVPSNGTPPVAALSALADGAATADDRRYWLRVDPVTLSADMTRVFMTARGLDDYDADERARLRDVLRATLRESGLELLGSGPERGYLALPGDPGFNFTPLGEALGRDVGDILPDADEARQWKRLLTDIQVALHHAPVNLDRRRAGRRAVNAAWLWGGGRLPRVASRDRFTAVYADDPVSRGLATLAGLAARPPGEAEPASTGGGRVLIDWSVGRAGAVAELDRIEAWIARLLRAAGRGEIVFTLLAGDGRGWRVDRGRLRRFWRREKPLHETFAAPGEAAS